jgi:hypothetical protein
MSERALATAPKQNTALAAPSRGAILQRKCACGKHTIAGAECEECKGKKGVLQRAPQPSGRIGGNGEAGIPPIVHNVLQSSGQPLNTDTLAFAERRFGHDFSGVRVHTDRQAGLSAEAVQARAYTIGRHIVFGAGAAHPSTSGGMHLLSHELAHVVQQSRGGGTPGIDGDPALENDADRAASDVMQGREARVGASSGTGLARQEKPAEEVFYEVNLPEGKKRLTAAEFEAYKKRALHNLRVDLKLVSDWADGGRESQVDMLKEYQGGVESLTDVIKKPKALIGIAADIWGKTTPPYIGMWSQPKTAAAAGIAAADRGDLQEAARMLRLADAHYRDAMHEWNSYREKTIGGAESLKSDLELVRDVSFAIALVAGAVVAAPVVAGVVATTGATGALATGLTAGGTALVTGTGGAVLGGGSAAVGTYSAEGKVDWQETKRQAAKFGKQGAVTGLTAGLGSALGAAGKTAELAQPLVQQAMRRCLTEAGVNVAGEITAEALDHIAPTERPEDKAEANKKALLPGPARAALVGCIGGAIGVPTSKLRSGTAKVTDTAVGAAVSFADVKLQGQTNKEALLAAAQATITSHVVGLGKKGTDAAKARKHSAKTPEAAAPLKPAENVVVEPDSSATSTPAGKRSELGGSAESAEAGKQTKPETGQPRRPTDQPEAPGPATSVKKEESKATKPTANGHEVVVTNEGIGVCSPPPCPVIHVEYAKELAANSELKKAYDRVQAARKQNPERAAELADLLIKNLEQVRANKSAPIEPPSFATAEQRERIETAVDQANKLKGGQLNADEFNKYLQSAKTPEQLESMIAHMEERVADKTDVAAAALRTDHKLPSPARIRLGRATHEQVLGRGMEGEGGAIPLDHDRHHVAPKAGGDEVGDKIRGLLDQAHVSVDDPASGVPLAGRARDPRAVHESSFPHNRAHTEARWRQLQRDLETVRGDPEATRAMLRRHGQDLYEGRVRGVDENEFRLGSDDDD